MPEPFRIVWDMNPERFEQDGLYALMPDYLDAVLDARRGPLGRLIHKIWGRLHPVRHDAGELRQQIAAEVMPKFSPL